MKRILAILLSITMLLTGCAKLDQQSQSTNTEEDITVSGNTDDSFVWEDIEPEYNSLDDELLLAHVEDLVYRDTVTAINNEEYFVENVSAVYISKEYLEEVAFNSQTNIFFGYTLAELNELFQDTRYIFTLDERGTTTIQELQEIEDVSTETMLKNVAIGTGVILVCVTVSVVSAGTGAPAVSMIFAASAKTGTIMAASSSAFGGISAGIVKGIQTGDFKETLEATTLGASEGFKWGAISGAIVGGSSEAFLLKGATKGGLTMNEAASIQAESKLPIDVIAQLPSMEEYTIYKNSGLKTMMVNGKTALVPKIDLNFVSQLPNGTEITNLARMQHGMTPIDPLTGTPYELHHIAQKNNGTLAVLTQEQHRGKGEFAKLHKIWKDSEVNHRTEWNKTVKEFWKYLGNYYVGGGA